MSLLDSWDNATTATSPLMENRASIKEKLLKGDYTLNQQNKGHSKVWSIFSKINDDVGVEIRDLVACTTCFNIYKFTGSTSNLVKHKCYTNAPGKLTNVEQINVDMQTKHQGTTLLTEWVVTNCRSFKIVEDSGLKNFSKFLINVGARFGPNVNIENLLPHPTTISRNIAALYETHFAIIKNELLKYKCHGYSLTSDIWTDGLWGSSYLSCTVHYVKEGKLINRLLSIKSMEGESCTGFNIKDKMKEILRHFGCDLEVDKPIIVTDRGANMIAAFREGDTVHCVNHLLHNTIEKAVKQVPELDAIVKKCSKLVKYFKKSGANCNLEVTLKSLCPTRWNTVYYLLKSIEVNWVDITNLLIEKNETSRIANINIMDINSIVRLLAEFEEASKKLESSNVPTIHLAKPYIHKLKKKCVVDINDTNEMINTFKSVLDNHLTSTVLQNLTKYHNLALSLFPPTKKLLQFSPHEKDDIIKACKEIMETFSDEIVEDLNETKADENVFEDFMETQTVNNNSKIDKEIENYSTVNVVYTEDFDCIEWWNIHKNYFPLLFKTSCKILSIPCSSAASERAFSDAGNLITEKRCVIASDSDKIDQIMFCHSNIERIF